MVKGEGKEGGRGRKLRRRGGEGGNQEDKIDHIRRNVKGKPQFGHEGKKCHNQNLWENGEKDEGEKPRYLDMRGRREVGGEGVPLESTN
jgi:hypothetical protein